MASGLDSASGPATFRQRPDNYRASLPLRKTRALPNRKHVENVTLDTQQLPDLTALNERHAIPGHIRFATGPGGLPVAQIENAHASASVCLLGGHVLTFQPHTQEPVLWMSQHSSFELGQPIRGGIPVCWPWFGAHPSDPNYPSHGFARRCLWNVLDTAVTGDGATCLRLALPDSDGIRAMWPQPFSLELAVVVNASLRVSLTMRNLGSAPVKHTCALHSYFAVSDVANVRVRGLEGHVFIDTVGPQPRQRREQNGPITFAGETDRVYVDTADDCLIDDPGLKHSIRVAKQGSRSTVVWNPWIAKSARMEDFGDDEYPGMVCVETTNAADDAVTLTPGAAHELTTILSVEPFSG